MQKALKTKLHPNTPKECGLFVFNLQL